jgi:hypothetical protein
MGFASKTSLGQRWSSGLFVIFLGSLCLGAALHLFNVNWQFNGPIKHVTGVVENLYVQSGRHSSSLVVRYHYNAGDLLYRETMQATQRTWSAIHIGGIVPIKYVSANPALSRLDLPEEDRLQNRILCIPSLMAFIFLGFGCYFFRKTKS